MRISDWSSDVCSSDLLANFRFLDNAKDPGLRSLDLRKVGRADLDHAFIVNVDLRASFRDDFADDLAAGADDVTNLRLVDLDRLDTRSMCRQFSADFAQSLRNFAQDVRPAFIDRKSAV